MATLVLGAVGTSVGGMFGGAVLGMSGAAIGGMIGSTIGGLIDNWIIMSLQPGQRYEGQRIDTSRITSSTEGVVIPRVFGVARMGGNIIWATDFREEYTETTEGGKGGGPEVTTTEYRYYASFAVAICEGPITGIGRVWADGELLDMTDITWRWYPGSEGQGQDPAIVAAMGAAATPAYRGTAYVVLDDLLLTEFGNRLPQLTFEVFRPLADEDTAEGLVPAVTLIPGTGEFAYSTDIVKSAGEYVNTNAAEGRADLQVSLDLLEALVPSVESVSVVVAWFGTDLRAGECDIRPGVETSARSTEPSSWVVDGVSRGAAHLVSVVSGRPVYGGTPSDKSVAQTIAALKSRGYRVTFYPFVLMDVPAGNALPNPYSDNAAASGQPAFPWRGRITCSPAPGYAGSVDEMAAAASQISAFFGSAQPSDFDVDGEEVSWTGGSDWGFRRMVLHYAHLCAAAGGVDAFLIGSEMRGITSVRQSAATFPAVAELKDLAGDVRAIVGAGTEIGYAADWSEYHSIQTETGPELQPNWNNPRVGWTNTSAGSSNSAETWGPFASAVAYASSSNTAVRQHDPVAVAAGATYKVRAWIKAGSSTKALLNVRCAPGSQNSAIEGFFASPTVFNQAGGAVSDVQSQNLGGGFWLWSFDLTVGAGFTTAQVGVGNRNPGQSVHILGASLQMPGGGLLFHLDPLWSDANIDFIGIDNYMPLSDWRDGWEHLDAQAGVPSIYDLDYLRSNIAGGEGFDWFYASPGDRAAQIRTPITDGAYGKPWVFRYKDLVSWWSSQHHNRPGGVESGSATAWVPQSKPIRFTELGCPAVDRGTNQPNVFHDPKSSESFVPYFSRGWRDDSIQRAYLEATYSYWRTPANNPASGIYGGRMVDVDECAAWTWDTRPYPFFPALVDVWSDGDNWRLGHWLTGRLGSASLRAVVRRLCRDAGLPANRIDVSGLFGSIEGFVVTAVESPRTSISMLARHFGFDACESEGVIRFVSRGRAPALSIGVDDMVRRESGSEVFEMVRAQESELPQALKWQVSRNDEEFDAIVVEARRATVDSARISSETFPFVVAPEEADRRCRRALQEAWVGRERATFALPPSRLALDPTDVVTLDHDGRAYDLRLAQITDGEARAVEGLRQDRHAYDLPPVMQRSSQLRRPMAFLPPLLVFLDLPQIREGQVAYRPFLAVGAIMASGGNANHGGAMSVFRSADPDNGFRRLTTFNGRARLGTLSFDLHSGPVHRLDHGNALWLHLPWGTLASISDLDLFAGGNALAVETSPGAWEIVQAGAVELVAPGQYKLTRLLRGQRGTEWAMEAVVAAGATVVVLDSTLVELPIRAEDVGVPWFWRVGPSRKGVMDSSYQQAQFTPLGRGVEPFAGVHAAQPYREGREVGDLDIRWVRRSRALAADIWGAGEVPLGEESEAYEVDILDGAALKRTLSASAPAVTYTAAQQAADWGAPLSPGASLQIVIYQIAPVAGRGFPYPETLFL